MQVYFLSQANESLQFQQITSWVRQPKRTWSSFRDFLLLRPEFFTARCKIGWDWINLERCYSRKLNIAARMIGYLWSIKSIIFSSENVSRNKTFLKIISMNQDMFKSLQKDFGSGTHIALFERHISCLPSSSLWTPWYWSIQINNFVLIYCIRKYVATKILILRSCVLKLKSETFNLVWKISLRFEK